MIQNIQDCNNKNMKENTAKKPISDNSLFKKINWFISEESAYLNNQLSIANVVAEDHADKNQQRWHWLHLQNFITVLKKYLKVTKILMPFRYLIFHLNT